MLTCPCGFTAALKPDSAAWARAHRYTHLLVYPRADSLTIANLDRMVTSATLREHETTVADVEQHDSEFYTCNIDIAPPAVPYASEAVAEGSLEAVMLAKNGVRS